MGDVIEVLQAKDLQWYWHRRAANGRIVADSGQRFKRKWSAKRSAKREARPLGLIVRVLD